MTGKKRRHTSRSSSRSLSRERSEDRGGKKHTSDRKLKKKRKRSPSKSSTESESDSSSTSRSRGSSPGKHDSRKKHKSKKRKEKKKKKKSKKKLKKDKQKMKKVSGEMLPSEKTKPLKPKKTESEDDDIDRLLQDRAKAMAPMTKEEWEKRQSIVRRVYDEESGRHRLIKGDGEVLEEIVSRDRHREINKQATRGDGEFFQATMAAKLNK